VISVAPGRHTPRAGTHAVTWWDPRALELGKTITGGMRQRQILEADEARVSSTESVRAHAAWQQRRATALIAGALPSVTVQSVTEAASMAEDETCAVARTDVDRAVRPGGTRFGRLVHAVLAAIDLRGGDVPRLAAAQARLIGASDAEVAAAVTAVRAALAHPLLVRAAAATEVRREAPIVLADAGGTIEGVLDLAFLEGDAWTVVDFKTDAELGESIGERLEPARAIARYAAQVRLYAAAITAATGLPATGTLLVV
jgi:ATP-dependent exoDNAse (exonuclease V) beta subunit